MALWYDKEAYALLKKCSDARDLIEWNTYRKETNYAPINLRFANLKDFYLVDADLRDVDFRGAYLKRAKCNGADVDRANISTNFYWYIFFMSILITILIVFGLKMMGVGNNEIALGVLVLVLVLALGLGHVGVGVGALVGALGGTLGGTLGDIAVDGYVSGGYVSGVVSGVVSIVVSIVGIVGILVLLKDLIDILSSIASKSIAYAKYPEKAIGFDTKYLKDISIPLSSRSEKEIAVLKELLEKEQDEKEKQVLQHKLEELQKEKEDALKTEAYAKTQQIKIQNALNHILKPYEYMERNISKLSKHNYFFYGVILILLGAFVYALSAHYLDARSNQFLDVLKKDTVSFGSLFGVILFYATPILFGMSIIVYSIAQINKNIQSIEGMQEQKRSIEVLQSTLLAQTEIADVRDDEIKALTQALQKGALEKMFGKEKPAEKTPKEKSTYREKLLITNLSKALTQALK